MRHLSPGHFPLDFLLERFVHQILSDDPAGVRHLLAQALRAAGDPQWLMAEILWPAAECLAQLRHDRLVSLRTFNQATRSLTLAAGHLDAHLPAADSARRRLLILTASGEPGDLGAHLLSILAEAAGFATLFAGAGLSAADAVFALAHLQPDALVIHGSLPSSLPAAQSLVAHLQACRWWPQVQIACVGAMLGTAEGLTQAGDLSSHHPVEILELLSLCPDHRTVPGLTAPSALHMPADTTPAIHAQAIDDLLRHYFPPRPHVN